MARMVLVADDSPTIQKRALGILKGEGFEVETVSNGVAALKRLAVIHPSVILADVSMPGRDGYEVCEFVKKSAELAHVPVLLVASDMEPYDLARGEKVRAAGMIMKPFVASELISMVTKLAAQFELAISTRAAPAAPSAVPQPMPESVGATENSDDSPTLVPQPAPDLSTLSEGVPFAEASTEVTPHIPGSPAAPEVELTCATAPTPGDDALELPLIGMEAATREPVFVEEQPAQALEAPSPTRGSTTRIFRSPAEIAEPVWKDEATPPPAAPEPGVPLTAEPLVEAAPDFLELPADPPLVPPASAAPVTAASLDSISLHEAATARVYSPLEAAEYGPIQAVPREVDLTESAAADVLEFPSVEHATVAEAATDFVPVAIIPSAPGEGASVLEVAPPGETPEAVATEAPALDAGPQVAAPPPAFDWNLFYTVVRKAVVKMSPPSLPAGAVEDLARRLADEIALEITSEAFHAQP